MKHETKAFDGACEAGDFVQVRVQQQPFGKDVVYVDVNGVTVARVGHIDPGTVQVVLDSEFVLNRRGRSLHQYAANRRIRK